MSRLLELAGVIGGTALFGIGLATVYPGSMTPPDAWLTIEWPRDVDEDAVVALLRHLASTRRPQIVAFEVRHQAGRISHLVGVASEDTGRLRHLFATHLPDALLEPTERVGAIHHAVGLRLGTRERSLRTDAKAEAARAVLGALASGAGGAVVFQCLLGSRLAPTHVSKQSSGLPSTALRRALASGNAPLDARARTELAHKVGDHGFRCVLRVGTTLRDPKPAKSAVHRVVAGLRVAQAPGVHWRVRSIRARDVENASPPHRWAVALNVAELSGLLGWPVGDATYPGVTRTSSRRLPVPSAVASTGRIIGDGNHPTTRRPVALSTQDWLSAHVLGPTGVGKSTLLANLALADITAGRGVVVIEPKGDLVADLLARIPPERQRDVVLLDPSDDRAPVGTNPLLAISAELAADHVLAVFRGMYGDYLGPRTTDVLHAAVLTLARSPGATLTALPLLLTDAGLRRDLTHGLRDDLALGPFWAWYEGLSDPERGQVIAPVMNKTRFLMRERVRHVLGQRQPKFDISSVFTERKILLVPLSKGALGGETAGLIGSLVVAQLWAAAQARARVTPSRRHPVSLVIDEFQDFLHLPTDLADVLATARSYGISLVLAHQHLAQLSPGMRAGVMANARNRICFRLSAEDASVIARSTDRLDANDLQSLGRYEIYTSLVGDGATQPFCSATTRALAKRTGAAARIRRLSREQFGRSRDEIEEELRELWGHSAKPAQSGALGSRPRKVRREEKGDAS